MSFVPGVIALLAIYVRATSIKSADDVSADARCSDGDCVELLASVLGDDKPDPAAIATMKTGMSEWRGRRNP